MARWDVFRNGGGRAMSDTPYLLDIQADLLSDLRTRVVVPLRRAEVVRRPIARLQPRLRIEGNDVVMDTPMLVGAPFAVLGQRVTNLADEAPTLLGALSLLLTGA